MRTPFSVYSDWGLHDELGDRVFLNERLAMSALDRLEDWKTRLGLAFDYYLMDCFWFDREKGYRHFDRKHWPRGFQRARDRMLELGMTPGLWYSVNGAQLQVPAWQKSQAENNWHYSLVDGPYSEELEASWRFAIEEWNVGFLKLDFAALGTAAKGVKRPDEETYRLSVLRLKDILRRLRAEHPHIKVISHCGFWRGGNHGLPTAGPNPSPVFDPSWLEVLDAMFSGDPHPTDVPRTDLVRNIDLYQDRGVWRVHQDGFPLHRIEDHGVVIGTTNTCCYRGRRGFRRSHLAQLARGAGRDMLYGDPRVLTDEDAKGIIAARGLFFDAFRRNLETQFLGDGEPGLVPWHGYLTGGGSRGLLYIVNGSNTTQHIRLPLTALFEARVLFHDGRRIPPVTVQPDRLSIELLPEQMALVGLGEYAQAKHDLGSESEVPLPASMGKLPVTFRRKGDELIGELGSRLPAGAKLHIVARVFSPPPHSQYPLRIAKQETKTTRSMKPKTHELVRISVKTNGKVLKPEKLIPDVPVWSGISWVAKTFGTVKGPCRIQVQSKLHQDHRIEVEVYVVRFEN